MPKIFIGKEPIESYAIVAPFDGQRAQNTAAYLLCRYVERISGTLLRREENERDKMIRLCEDPALPVEAMSIRAEKGNLFITGGKRGIIYAVIKLLEIMGVRRYAIDVCSLPTADVVIPDDLDYSFTEAAFEYRQFNGGAAHDTETKLWFRLNDVYGDPAYGDAVRFIGRAVHTLSGGYLLSAPEYVRDHPEYFALVNGKRITDGSGQVCLTSEGALSATIEEVKKRLRGGEKGRYISVSMDDNANYCRCPRCLAEIEKTSLSDLFFGFINKVARAVKKEFPDVLIHTIAYSYAVDPPSFDLEDNVAVQYCTMRQCRVHALDDPACPHNAAVADEIKRWHKRCKYLMVWDYTDNHRFNLMHQPDIVYYRRNMRFLAENGVRAVFFEDDHVPGDGAPCFSELKCYLLSSLAYDPYMTEEEFRFRINDFCEHYYGPGGKYVAEYLYKWAEYAKSEHYRFNGSPFTGDVGDFAPGGAPPEELDRRCIATLAPSVPPEKLREAVRECSALFDRAESLARDEVQRGRVRLARVHLDYYELFYTFDEVMEKGTAEEKTAMLARNETLIRDVWKYRFKRTLYRGASLEQASELVGMLDKSPRCWGYGWHRDPNK